MENLQGGTLALDHYYHLDERLRSFGLVTLYGATQDPFDHPVRVAVYDGLVDAGADPAIADRIGEAARRASQLPGQGLLSVVDFGEIDQGVPFVIEQTVPGPSLTDVVDSRDVFAPGEVADLVDRLARLLGRAHDHGIYHGNLTPGWIVFDDETADFQTASISHFGLGPSMRELVGMSQTVLTTDLVEAFAPECFDVAARDDESDGQMTLDDSGDAPTNPHLTAEADQWALAALAFRLLVGVHPFFDDPVDASEGILRIKTEDPPSLTEMGVEAEIADVVDRALDHDPEDRFETITDFATAFREAVDGPDQISGSPDAGGEVGVDVEPDDGRPAAEPDSSSQPDDLEPARETAAGSTGRADPGEPSGPRPSGYLLTAALVALVLTNVGWFFTTMADDTDDQPDDGEAAHQAADALPDGLQVRTRPDGAELWVVDPDDDTEQSLGSTPYVLTDRLVETSRLNLALRHDDYPERLVTIEETDTGRDLIVDLESPAQPD